MISATYWHLNSKLGCPKFTPSFWIHKSGDSRTGKDTQHLILKLSFCSAFAKGKKKAKVKLWFWWSHLQCSNKWQITKNQLDMWLLFLGHTKVCNFGWHCLWQLNVRECQSHLCTFRTLCIKQHALADATCIHEALPVMSLRCHVEWHHTVQFWFTVFCYLKHILHDIAWNNLVCSIGGSCVGYATAFALKCSANPQSCPLSCWSFYPIWLL